MSQISLELSQRLKKNLKKRLSLMKSWPAEAVRLYGLDLPNYPYIIDLYKDHALIWTRTREEFADDLPKEEEIKNWLKDNLSLEQEKIIVKSRTPRTRTEHYQKFSTQDEYRQIKEADSLFWVNLTDYVDTGLFLDHRVLRRWVAKDIKEFAKNNRSRPHFLNLFCYTCSVSVAAARAGAATINVDLSHKYLNWAQENFTLNQIEMEGHKFIRQSAMLEIKTENAPELFDFIYIDPPTFSNSKSATDFEVQKDHRELIEMNMKKLNQSGLMYFSCNKRSFQLDPAIEKKYQVINKSLASIPEDFDDKKIHQLYFIKHRPTS